MAGWQDFWLSDWVGGGRPPSYSESVLSTSGVVAYWRLGEASGTTTAADAAGTNTGTYTNNPTLGVTGLLVGDSDTAVSFDGANDNVSVPNATALNPTAVVSLEAWIKPTGLPAAGAFRSVVSKAEQYCLQFNGPLMEFTIIQGGIRRRCQAASGAVVAGQTYHVVGTYDGANQRLYINGVQVTTVGLTGAISTTANAVRIGSWNASEFFNGVIDEAAIYNSALTINDVQGHYNTGAPVVAQNRMLMVI